MAIPLLEANLCRMRQNELKALLDELSLDAALLTNRHYVHALTGYWHAQSLTPVAVVVSTRGPVALVIRKADLSADHDDSAVDAIATYSGSELGTMTEVMEHSMFLVADEVLGSTMQIGVCGATPVVGSGARQFRDISAEYQQLRRTKHADELAILRFAISVTEDTYSVARQMLKPGVSEIDIYVEMLSAATRGVGEQLSGWGNDFQSGAGGGPPRRRKIESGELAVYDVGVGVRGYRSDLCRTFAVNGVPREPQVEAHTKILEMFEWLEANMGPGVSCVELYDETLKNLDGWKGCSFPHHLGHGIGLDAHEVPRLNPKWSDTLQVGDVFAVEPGLYADNLNAGIRLEHNYVVTDNGVERLSSFPLDL